MGVPAWTGRVDLAPPLQNSEIWLETTEPHSSGQDLANVDRPSELRCVATVESRKFLATHFASLVLPAERQLQGPMTWRLRLTTDLSIRG
jgi:hypothetical protein